MPTQYHVERRLLEVSTGADTDIRDLTGDARRLVLESSIGEGQLLVFVPGSTAGITTIEYEPGALSDLARLFAELAPSDGSYAHNQRWGDGNGYSHVRAALLGPSLTMPVAAGELLLGTWQQIVLCDFDNRPRQRRVVLQVSGTRSHGRASAGPRGAEGSPP